MEVDGERSKILDFRFELLGIGERLSWCAICHGEGGMFF